MRGLPAATENRSGKGKAVYYGSYFNLDSARHLISRYAREHNLKPLFSDFPKEIEVTRRSKNGNDYYFILNHTSESVTLNPDGGFFDLIAGRESAAIFTLKPYEYKVLKK